MSLAELEGLQRLVEWGELPSSVFMMLQNRPATGILNHFESKYGDADFWISKLQEEIFKTVAPSYSRKN